MKRHECAIRLDFTDGKPVITLSDKSPDAMQDPKFLDDLMLNHLGITKYSTNEMTCNQNDVYQLKITYEFNPLVNVIVVVSNMDRHRIAVISGPKDIITRDVILNQMSMNGFRDFDKLPGSGVTQYETMTGTMLFHVPGDLYNSKKDVEDSINAPLN